MSVNVRILVVDDDPSVTSMLRRGLSYEGYTITVAASGREGLELALSSPPDLVILDVMMPGIDGIEVCRRLREGDADLPIIMLTARDEVGDQVLGLESGADDYVVKPFTFEVLLARIRALLRRTDTPSAELLRFSDLILDTASHTARRGDREIDLTTTEYELLLQFLRQPRHILAKDQLLTKVWGYDFEGNSNVLEVYVRYLRAKLEAGGEPRLIYTVRGSGYLLREPRPDEVEEGT